MAKQTTLFGKRVEKKPLTLKKKTLQINPAYSHSNVFGNTKHLQSEVMNWIAFFFSQCIFNIFLCWWWRGWVQEICTYCPSGLMPWSYTQTINSRRPLISPDQRNKSGDAGCVGGWGFILASISVSNLVFASFAQMSSHAQFDGVSINFTH